MSNYHLPEISSIERRIRGKQGKTTVEAPQQALDYNPGMPGTDTFDFHRAAFSCQRKSKKWWHSLFYFVVDAAKANAYTKAAWCWNKATEHEDEADRKPYMTRKAFYSAIAEDLMDMDFTTLPDPKRFCKAGGKVAGERGFPKRESVCFKIDPGRTTRGNCKFCYMTTKKKADCWAHCQSCGVNCHWECMRPWHVAVMRHHKMMDA